MKTHFIFSFLIAISRVRHGEKVPLVLIVRQAKQHFGEEIIMVNQFVMLVDSTISYIM